MGKPVVHFEVVGKDGDKLRSFYSELFDWDFQVMGGPMNYGVVQRNGNTNAEGAGIGGASDYEGHVTFYVEVPDIAASLEQIEARGGTRLMGPDEVPGAGIRVAHFGDPEGHVVGLVENLGE